MSANENKNVSKEVLINGIDEKKLSVINSLKEFGIESEIVQNYKDSINRMKEGEYSEVWVICGRYHGAMPDKTKYSNLLSQFIDCLIKYWGNGGGIVFWTDNSPLVAEVNFFLSKAQFEKQKINKKDPVEYSTVNFRIGGSYPGCRMLVKCEKARNASFNSHECIKCDGYDKYLYNANMTQIYEGITILSAIKIPQDADDQCYNDTENYEFATPSDFYEF